MHLNFSARMLLGLALIPAGCSFATRYPPEMRYPVRKDVIVKTVIAAQPDMLDSPGLLEDSITAAVNLDDKDKNAAIYPEKLGKEQRAALGKALNANFGTPYRPKVAGADAYESLALDAAALARGSEQYRKHCMHCHGVAGDGRGPTGPWVNPHPRDYRSGAFKFISTLSNADGTPLGQKPSRADLTRTLVKGIEGTSMPAFGVLPANEIQDIVSYVIHLSIRGQVEIETFEELLKAGANVPTDKIGEIVDLKLYGDLAERLPGVLEKWAIANKESSQIKPAAYPEKFTGANKEKEITASIQRGHKLFIKEAGCIACHNDFGRQAKYRHDLWGTIVRPANLSVSTYRGGRRPVDLFWRIKGGINPSTMPALPKDVTDEGTWDLVHFVQALPYPAMLPEDVRTKVYGGYLAEPEKKKEKDH